MKTHHYKMKVQKLEIYGRGNRFRFTVDDSVDSVDSDDSVDSVDDSDHSLSIKRESHELTEEFLLVARIGRVLGWIGYDNVQDESF